MAYNVRGKYINQEKYSNRRRNSLLDLVRITSQDARNIEMQTQRGLDDAQRETDSLGPFKLIKKISNLVAPLPVKVVTALADAVYSDKARDRAIDKGVVHVNTVKYLRDDARNADRKLREAIRKGTDSLRFGETLVDNLVDIGVGELMEAIGDSEGMEAFRKGEEAVDFKTEGFGEGRFIDFIKGGSKAAFGEVGKLFKNEDEYMDAVSTFKFKSDPLKQAEIFLRNKQLEEYKIRINPDTGEIEAL